MHPDQQQPGPAAGSYARDVIALLLLILGITGMATAAFFFDWRAGLAVLSTGAAFIGYRLSLREE